MSTTPPPQLPTLPTNTPSELTNLLNTLPSEYHTVFSNLFTILPPNLTHFFIVSFTSLLTYLPTTLPRVLTSQPPQISSLPPNFPTMVTEFINKLNILHGILITITRLGFPSSYLSPWCYNLLRFLQISLYTCMNHPIPTLLSNLRTSSFPFLRPEISEQDDVLITLISTFFSDLSGLFSPLQEVLCTLPALEYGHPSVLPYDHPLWDLKDFFSGISIDFMIRQLQIYLHNNPAAENYIDVLTVKYIYKASGKSDTDPENCRICLEEMKDGDKARRLGCLHEFHMDCIDRWLNTKETCPLCRTHISSTQ